ARCGGTRRLRPWGSSRGSFDGSACYEPASSPERHKSMARNPCIVVGPGPARKFLLAGRGGLNLTHSEPLETFLTRYRAAAERLRPAIEAFPPEALRAW